MEHTRELPLEQKPNLHKWAIPSKDKPTCSSTGAYYMCRTRHFRWKGQYTTEIQLLNTPHDRRCCHDRQAMTPLWCSSINKLCFPQKNWRANFRDRGWGRQRYLPPRFRGYMAAPTACVFDSSFNSLLISRILVDTNGNGQHHVISGINHGWMCVVDINSLVCCLAVGRSFGLRPRDRPARRDNTLGSWCQQHTSNHD